MPIDVHPYKVEGYEEPKEKEVKDNLEWYRDQKFGLMMHWGIYSQLGVGESWSLVDRERTSRVSDFISDRDEYKKEYFGLNRSFNPIHFNPELWADIAADAGFKYFIFTTKHHDGFTMYDTKYTDFKVTSLDCPYSTNKNANICKVLFDAFRKKGIAICPYFSKSDWHNDDFWENSGIGYKTDWTPSYDVTKNPEKWERFATFVKNQMLELATDFGRIEMLWLDGGQVQRNFGYDIHIEEIMKEVRKIQPWVIAVDRTAKGQCENVITPEGVIPPTPIDVPWESCIPIGNNFAFFYEENFKSVNEIIEMLVQVVAKGGNLALNVAPQPNGCIPNPVIRRLREVGRWLRDNGDAIYGTRPVPPYKNDDGNKNYDYVFYTQKKGSVYAIRIYKENGTPTKNFIIDVNSDCYKNENVKKISFVSDGKPIEFKPFEGKILCRFPEDRYFDKYGDAFKIEF